MKKSFYSSDSACNQTYEVLMNNLHIIYKKAMHCYPLRVSAKFGTCFVVSVNGTIFEAKMCTFTLDSTHFIFNKCPVDTHDGANAKFSTNSHETDNECGGNF
jgi:hypothetical protein